MGYSRTQIALSFFLCYCRSRRPKALVRGCRTVVKNGGDDTLGNGHLAERRDMNIRRICSTPVRIAPLQVGILGALSLSTISAAYFALSSIFSPFSPGVIAKAEWHAPGALETARTAAAPSGHNEQTLTRPIFSKTRRPQAAESQAGLTKDAPTQAAPLPAGISVRAVAIAGKARSAFLIWDASPEGKWVREGEPIQGWTVSSVRKLDLILQSGERSSRLTIDYSGNGSALTEQSNSKAAAEFDSVRVTRERGR